ncbi:MAG: Lipopolysaccharide heptosyltransferase I (EC [uncultured Sulfurovum sp.]|uniref:Lipopolysaccharide heptosyltransferase 1 n=1 Tax=uncultured Sulfurovum sp. TaxID=269237 RepID=A0A6S6TLA1_9BACT|nr:MAG: Lipopolysaccharide heptosyltransferase I (EC [uncultured Sulfurovum sp.]
MKIAIIKLSAMGDIIHAMVALQFIKKAHSDIKIDWIVEESFKEVLEHNPHIDNILTVNLKTIKKNKMALFSEVKKIRNYAKNDYDLVIDAQGLLKSAISSKLLGKQIIGFSKNSIRESVASYFYNQTIEIAYEKNAIDRNIKILCETLDIPVYQDNILHKEPFLFFKNTMKLPIQVEHYMILVVGASIENKIYPKEKFLEVVKNLDEQIVVIWANNYEHNVAQYLEANANNVIVAPKLTLNELKKIIAHSKLVIGGDTGPTHMAWGLNIPSITIFGNTPSYRNTYLTNINKVIKSDSLINPLKLDKSDFSIQKIEAHRIVTLAKELLND